MAQNSNRPARLSPARPPSAIPAQTTGSWSRARRIYLAVGIVACIAGAMMIALAL
ncbi:hypothetical protein QFZ36_000579 [Pseudarthrobacter siccitolerans]|uniref:Uncharacterized protein n=1 Tax=Pseudarthrobacter siccitolerans TaxID=861266 RepID=A0ABU0PGC3_9MICC|nr:hypothetical protein [Pseudarthrobacter siccitolerans]MDQ0673018.1 hypothetical protein [Pseudarthrobacter siccitolerans]